MVRYISCLAVALLAGTVVRAGELDADFGPAASAAPALIRKASTPANPMGAVLLATTRDGKLDGVKASELDAETPAQAARSGFGRGGFGGFGRGGFGRGFGGFGRGFGGFGRGWGGWGRGWGWGWGGWPGWGWGWGWPSYAYYPYYLTDYSIGFYDYPDWDYYW